MPHLSTTTLATLGRSAFRLDGPLFHVQEFPDGDLLVATQRSLRRLDPRSGEARWCVPALPNQVAVRADGARVAWNHSHDVVGILDAGSGALLGTHVVGGAIGALGWRDDEVVVARHDGVVLSLDPDQGRSRTHCELRRGRAYLATFVEGGRAAVSVGYGAGTALVRHDLRTGATRIVADGLEGEVLEIGAAPGGEAVWVLGQGFAPEGVRAWLAWFAGARYQQAWHVELSSSAERVRLARDGSRLAVRVGSGLDPGGDEVQVQVRSCPDGALLLAREVDPRDTFALSADGGRLAIGCDGFREFAVPGGEEVRRQGATAPVPDDQGYLPRCLSDLAYEASGRLLGIVATSEGPWELRDLDAGSLLATRTPQDYGRLRFFRSPAPGATWVATEGGGSGPYRLEELLGDTLQPVPMASAGVACLGPTSAEGLVLDACAPGGVALRELATGRTLRALGGHRSRAQQAAVAPGGRWVLMGQEDGQLWLADLEDGAAPPRSLGRVAGLRALAFLGGGARFAVARRDGEEGGGEMLLRDALLQALTPGTIREVEAAPEERVEIRDTQSGAVLEEAPAPFEYFQLDCAGDEVGLRAGGLRSVFRPGAEPLILTRRGPGANPQATLGLAGGRVAVADEEDRLHLGPARDPGAGEADVDPGGNPFDWNRTYFLVAQPDAAGFLVRNPDGPGLRTWDPGSGRGARKEEFPDGAEPVAVAPDGSWTLLRVGPGLQVYRRGEAEPMARYEYGDLGALRMTPAPDASTLLVQGIGFGGGPGGAAAMLLELPSLEVRETWEAAPDTAKVAFWFSRDSQVLRTHVAERFEGGRLRHRVAVDLWSEDESEGPSFTSLDPGEGSWLTRAAAAFALGPVRGGGLVILGGGGDGADLLRILGGELVVTELAGGAAFGAVDAAGHHSPSDRLAVLGKDGRVQVHDASTGALLATLEAGPGEVREVSFDVSGRVLAVVCADRTLLAWSLEEAAASAAA